MVGSWRSRRGPARSLQRYGGRSITETAAVGFRAAECDSGRAITSVTGPKEAQRRSPISPCSVAGTTARFTRRVISWIDSLTVSCGSAARTAGFCPRSRLLLKCPAIQLTSCEHGTMRRGLRCTRGPPRRVGWESAWTWAGRSTSCTLWRGRVELRDTALGQEPVRSEVPRGAGVQRPATRKPPGESTALDALGIHVEGVERLARRHEESVALDSAEAEVGAALREQDAPYEPGGGIEDRHAIQPFAPAPAAPEVAVGIAAHPVRDPGSGIHEHAAVGERRPTVDHVEDANLARRGAADHDVELRLVRCEAEAVGARDRKSTRL